MQFAVLQHHGRCHYNIKLEVLPVPGVCSGVAGGEGICRATGQPPPWSGPARPALGAFGVPRCMESVGSLLGGYSVPQEVRLRGGREVAFVGGPWFPLDQEGGTFLLHGPAALPPPL